MPPRCAPGRNRPARDYRRPMASGAEHLAPGLHEYLVSHSTALDTLRALPSAAAFALAFIDADKTGYAAYWEEIVPRPRPGGVILVDNTLLHGRIFHAEPDPDAVAIRQFNEHVLAEDRVVLAMLPVGDGLTVARRK